MVLCIYDLSTVNLRFLDFWVWIFNFLTISVSVFIFLAIYFAISIGNFYDILVNFVVGGFT